MSNVKSNMVSPGKKPNKKTNSKKKVVASKSVKSPIVKDVVSKKEVVPKKIMKTTGPSAPSKPVSIVAPSKEAPKTVSKPVVKTVNSTKQTVKKPKVNKANAETDLKKSTVAKNVNKSNASAVKTENKAVKGSKAVKSTTKGVKSAATLSASTKTGTTATNVTKAAASTTKGVAKAATSVNKQKTKPKKKTVVVQTEEDLNKEIDKYISNAGIPAVSTSDIPKTKEQAKEERTEEIEDVVEKDYSKTQEYKDLAAELREQAQREAREEYERELELSNTTIINIEDAVEQEVSATSAKEEKKPDHIVTGETVELSSMINSFEDTSAYQDIDEALKYQIKNEIDKNDKKKKFNIFKCIKWILALVLIAISGLFGYTAISSGYLPMKYSIIVGVVIGVIDLIVALFLSRKHLIFNIFGIFLVLSFSTIFMVAYNYLDSTFDVLKDVLTVKETTTEYYYVVLSGSEYQAPKDLEGKTLGLVNTNADNVMNKVAEDVSVSFNKYDTAGTMIYALELHEIEAMVISSTAYDVMSENDENFASSVRILENIDVLGEPDSFESTIEANKSFVLYISGVDTRDTSSVPTYGLSDVNMLAVINPNSHRVLLVNIPRDYYVQLHGTDGKLRDKLTHAGLYGVGMSMETLSDLFNVEVNAYVRVNFQTLTTLVDDIDGVDIYSDISFNSYHYPGWVVPKGTSHMNGKKALAFARERYAYQSGDRHRGENQQAVITAIINKLSTNKKYLLQYDKILGDVAPYIATNIKEDTIQELVKEQINSMPSWSVESISVNGTNSSNYTYSWPTQYSYVMIPDQGTIDSAKAKMSEVMKS